MNSKQLDSVVAEAKEFCSEDGLKFRMRNCINVPHGVYEMQEAIVELARQVEILQLTVPSVSEPIQDVVGEIANKSRLIASVHYESGWGWWAWCITRDGDYVAGGEGYDTEDYARNVCTFMADTLTKTSPAKYNIIILDMGNYYAYSINAHGSETEVKTGGMHNTKLEAWMEANKMIHNKLVANYGLKYEWVSEGDS